MFGPITHSVLQLYYRTGRAYRVPFGPLRGLKMLYDEQMNFQNMLGLSERRVFELLSRLFSIHDDKIEFVDLGANRGLYSLFAVRSDKIKTVYSFEPNPTLSAILKNHCAINSFSNIHVYEKACADQSGTMTFYLGESDSSASLISGMSGEVTRNTFSVETISLDDFFEDKSVPAIIKIDIEGAGYLALKGAQNCIKRKRPIIYFESHSKEEDESLRELMKDHSYSAYRLQSNTWVLPKDICGNIILIPSEKQKALSALF